VKTLPLRAENPSFEVNPSDAILALGAALRLGPQDNSQLPSQVPPTGVSIRNPIIRLDSRCKNPALLLNGGETRAQQGWADLEKLHDGRITRNNPSLVWSPSSSWKTSRAINTVASTHADTALLIIELRLKQAQRN